jgi:bifunctional DNA-binding transcriptional regulator/antitoxin component of YhaV-PrlF toxin-antitoxin module
MNTQLSSKGQIVLPVELREVDHLIPGQVFEIERVAAGEYLLKRIREPGKPGLLQWLKDCPSPDWFREVDSELTDSLR